MEGPIVRYVGHTCASVWVEFSVVSSVKLVAVDVLTKKVVGTSHVVQTTQVGKGHYAIPYVTKLKPGRLYRYYIEHLDTTNYGPYPWHIPRTPWQFSRNTTIKTNRFRELSFKTFSGPVFRTLAESKQEVARFAFGSCRKWKGGSEAKPGQDALDLFAKWMADARVEKWPHCLLLVGDQIYADDVSDIARHALERSRGRDLVVPTKLSTTKDSDEPAGVNGFHLVQFSDFCWFYRRNWSEKGVKKVFANLATYMIFDDHDITDDWNLTGGWVDQMQATAGWPELVVDGLIAYWLYQGWGNLDPAVPASDPLSIILEDHAHSRTDALGELRRVLFEDLDADPGDRLRWNFHIPSSPPVFAIDARNDRVLKKPGVDKVGKSEIWFASPDDKIASPEQIRQLAKDLAAFDEPAILISGSPVFMPFEMAVGLALGARPQLNFVKELRAALSVKSGQEEAEFWENFRRDDPDADQWPAFPSSYEELMELATAVSKSGQNKNTLVFLSGDVHFSYATVTRFGPSDPQDRQMPTMIQLVCSPINNAWTEPQRKELDAIRQRLAGGYDNIESRFASGSGQIGPGFTKTQASARGLLDSGLLFGNSISIVEFGKDRDWMNTFWWSASVKTGKLSLAANFRRDL